MDYMNIENNDIIINRFNVFCTKIYRLKHISKQEMNKYLDNDLNVQEFIDVFESANYRTLRRLYNDHGIGISA